MSDQSGKSVAVHPSFAGALPFWLSLSLIPVLILAATQGGLALLAPPLLAWGVFSVLDHVTGLNEDNADPETPDPALFWYRAITLLWFPIEAVMLFGLIWYQGQAEHLNGFEKWALFFGVGIMSGSIGITYAHELMHQRTRLERWLGDLLLALALYSHFRSEHLHVHHRHVGTPRDAVSARYNEGFHRFFPRVLIGCFGSALRAERAMLARRGLGPSSLKNPFWRYGALQLAALGLAFWLGGLVGLVLFIHQAFIAIWQLELTNYVEHYGLTRKHLGDGKFEPVRPRHSWNASHRATNWLLINLQRHSDHHIRPDRRFPLLQTYGEDEAPQLPYGYPLMTMAAMVPPIWRRVMNPKVREWRARFYPEIEDWTPYRDGTLPFSEGS